VAGGWRATIRNASRLAKEWLSVKLAFLQGNGFPRWIGAGFHIGKIGAPAASAISISAHALLRGRRDADIGCPLVPPIGDLPKAIQTCLIFRDKSTGAKAWCPNRARET